MKMTNTDSNNREEIPPAENSPEGHFEEGTSPRDRRNRGTLWPAGPKPIRNTEKVPLVDIQVYVYPDSLSAHVQQIYAGLWALHAAGKVRLSVGSRSFTGSVHGSSSSLWVLIRNPKEKKTRRVCFDMSDGSRILLREQLEACDWYFKRSFYEPAIQALPPTLRVKILPYGLNYCCTTGSGLGVKLYLALRALMTGSNSHSDNRFKSGGDALKLLTSSWPFTWLDQKRLLPYDDFEAQPDEPTYPRVLFQTRVWDPQLYNEDAPALHAINEFRANTVRALKKHFGTAFVGGIEPSNYANRHYSACLSAHSTEQMNYVSLMKQSLIGVCTIGLHRSTPWKLGEYIAASRCIVSERLNYSLPVPLQEKVNYITFTTPAECVQSCETILANPNWASEMRRANQVYYQEQVRPEALMSRCLGIALDN